MTRTACVITLIAALAASSSPAQEQQRRVFEDFDSVEAWEGFELDDTLAHHGDTSALWRDHPDNAGVSSTQIPHDWSEWNAFTFWVHNETEVDTRFMCIISSENEETEGPDYWGVPVPLNFTGWKRFGLMLRGGGARQPVGWHKIDSIRFTASGWNNEPHPEAVVRIDQLELRDDIGGPGPLLTDEEFFSLLREDMEGLAPGREAAAAGDYALAKQELLDYYRARDWPTWTFDPADFDRERNPDYNTSRADYILSRMFDRFGREAYLGEDIDWSFNGFDPDEPEYTPEWTYQLVRFREWRILGQAWWATGDDRYAEEFVSQMLDFIHDEPPPVLGNPNSGPTWRTIEQGIRTSGSWMDAYHYFLFADAMTPEAHCTFLKSWVEHARTLTRMAVEHPEHRGNWVTMECNGLAHIGVMFPEFTESEHWRDVAYDRLMTELDRQVYPDGAQKELTTGYHQVARGNFMRALEPALRNDFAIPDGYLDRLRRMYEYNLRAMKQNGRLPPLNDAGDTSVVASLREAYETWDDERFLWGATLGAEGEALDETSHFFPWAGQAVMRSGWDPNDLYMMFEIGPFGIGHQHEDKLGIYLHGYGTPLLTEAGSYTYDRSRWRRFVLSTPAHNTIMVDGMGQHRRGQDETYETDEPLEGVWASTGLFDWCVGRYEEGYGSDLLPVTHERTVVFVKPDYFVVIDRLLDAEGEHTYEALFNLDADEVTVADDGLTVGSAAADAPGVTLMPLATDGLSLRIAHGQEEPLLGWVPRENHRAIPCAVYSKTGRAPQPFVTLIAPQANADAPVVEPEVLTQTDEMLALRVARDGREDTILYAFDGAMPMDAGGISTDGRLAVVRRGADGVSGAVIDGTALQADGEPVPITED